MIAFLATVAVTLSSVSAFTPKDPNHWYIGWNGVQCRQEKTASKIPGRPSWDPIDQPDAYWCKKQCMMKFDAAGDCKAWNWEKASGKCYLFKNIRNSDSNSEFVSGEMCEDLEKCDTVIENMNVQQPNIRDCEDTASEADCGEMCGSLDGCMTSTWDSETNQCCLKSSWGNMIREEGVFTNIRCKSGQTLRDDENNNDDNDDDGDDDDDDDEDDDDEECKPGDITGAKFPGNNIGECFKQDHRWCKMRCDFTHACIGSTIEDGKCCMKSWMANKGEPAPGAKAYRRCSPGKPKEPCDMDKKYVREVDMAFKDEDILPCFELGNGQKCKNRCQETEGCMAAQFGDGKCCLKRSAGQPYYKKNFKTWRFCSSGQTPRDDDDCGTDMPGKKFVGGKVKACFKIKDQLWCDKQCWMDGECKGYSFFKFPPSASTGKCCLHKSTTRKKDRDNWNSRKKCGCEEKIESFKWHDATKCLSQEDAPDFDWCAKACGMDNGCMGATFEGGKCCLSKRGYKGTKVTGAASWKKCPT